MFDMRLTVTAYLVNLVWSANWELCCISSYAQPLCSSHQNSCFCFWSLCLDFCNFLLPGCPQYLLSRPQKVQNSAAHLILKVPETDHNLIFTLCTGIQSALKSDTRFLLFVSVLSLPSVLSICLIYSWSRHPLGNSDFLQPGIYVDSIAKVYSEHSFSHFAPAPVHWNILPKDVRFSPSVSIRSGGKMARVLTLTFIS